MRPHRLRLGTSRFASFLYGVLLLSFMPLGCHKPAPPPPVEPPHVAAASEVQLGDTLDSIEGFRGGVLAVLPQARHAELRTLGERMIQEHFRRGGAVSAWRKKHFPKAPPSEPLKNACGEDVLFGKSLPMNPTDVQMIDAVLLQSQCEVLVAGTILQQAKDPELIAIAHEVIGSTAGEVSTLLQWKRAWGGAR